MKSNNKQIAKNTVFLYIRMIIAMFITLYTSRVVLIVLGVVDFGLYNVVGGVVTMLSFLSNSMSIAAQRFFSYEIGKNRIEKLNRIFNTCLVSHIFIAITVLLISEIIAPWFLETKMNIPTERNVAAYWVLQFSIFSFVISVIQVPYIAIILSKEKMNIYAYIGILEVILKLIIVYFLLIFSYDKLIIYAVLQFSISLLIFFANWKYCNKRFPEVRVRWIWDKPLFNEILSYSGWTMFGEIAWIISGQGVNVILNIFCGPVLNAANAIAGQVSTAINRFVSSFQTAMNPQIIKTYAVDEFDETKLLVYRGSKVSYFLLLLLSLPLFLEIDFILKLWLKEVPNYSAIFTRLYFIVALIAIISNYLAQVVRANGNIRKYQIWVSFIISLSFPLSYVLLYLNFPPYHIVTISAFLQFVLIFARICLVRKMINITIREFVKEVISPILIGTLFAIILPVLFYLEMNEGFVRLFVVFLISSMCVTLSAYYLGLNKFERNLLYMEIKNRFHIIIS